MVDLHQILAGNMLIHAWNHYKKSSCRFQVLGLWLETNVGLGYHQKSTETRLKKNPLKMACQKVCKLVNQDIIVKVKLQSPILTSFYITVANKCENDAGMRLPHSLQNIGQQKIIHNGAYRKF